MILTSTLLFILLEYEHIGTAALYTYCILNRHKKQYFGGPKQGFFNTFIVCKLINLHLKKRIFFKF